MTNQNPTPEQITAYRELTDPARIFTAGQMALLAPLLPDSLTNPQPALPTEPGVYVDAHDGVVIRSTTRWRCDGAYVEPESLTLPLTRLVPERPRVTREQIRELVVREWFNARGTENMTEQIDALLNGTRDE